jgi:Zn-dependent protease with chaperone function
MNRFSAHDVLHPLDRMARDNLEQIPGLRKASDLYLRSVDERAMRQSLMSSALRLSPTQLPRIYRLLPPICDAFGIDEPELYLAHSTEVNAWTFGQTRTSIVLYSGLLEYMKEAEIEAVLAHECGHILCQHVLYRSMALALERAAGMTRIAGLIGGPMRLALLNWVRKSELTADRAAVAYLGRAEPMLQVLLRFAGVVQWARDDEYSLDEFARQAAEFETMMENRWEKFVQWWSGTGGGTHPLLALRVREVQRWCAAAPFPAIAAVAENLRRLVRCEHCRHPLSGQRHCEYCGRPIRTGIDREEGNGHGRLPQ